VLLTTHYLEEAEALADDLSIMRGGEIVRSGTPAQIVADHPSQISFSAPGATVPDLRGVRVSHDGDRTVLYVDDLQPELTRLLRWAEEHDVRLDRLVARSASLESVFLGIADRRAPDKNDEPDGLRILEGSDR
jgi:ABC-2 type transport system ATP-binding protein